MRLYEAEGIPLQSEILGGLVGAFTTYTRQSGGAAERNVSSASAVRVHVFDMAFASTTRERSAKMDVEDVLVAG